jgi:putative flippase GtrA
MVGGGVYFWSGYAVFALLYSGFKVDWLWAKIIADIIGWTLNYLIQRYWAFKNPKLNGHEIRISGRYIALTLLNLAIDYAIVAGLKSAGVTPYLGMFISSMFFTVWNYVWYRFWVFKPAPSDTA